MTNKLDQVSMNGHIVAMSDTVNIAEAKANLSRLVARAAGGEEIVISRAGKPLARIVPLEERPKREFGAMRHRWPHIPDDLLLAPMDEEELRWAEGKYQDREGLYRGVRETGKMSPGGRKSIAHKRRKP